MSTLDTTHTSYAAGWYPDANMPGTERYYDGSAWTEQTRVIAADAVPAKKTLWKRKGFIIPVSIVGGLIVISGIANAANGGSADEPTAKDKPAAVAETAEPKADEPVTIAVPDMTGKTFGDAAAALAAAGLTTGVLDGKEAWVVTSTLPVAGEDVEAGRLIILNGEEPKPVYTVGQQSALDKANSYMRTLGGFSRQGLIDQLMFNQFSAEDATFAVDSAGFDWNKAAADKAASYMKTIGGFSRGSLIDQLLFNGFTQAEAEFGVASVGL